MASPQENPLMSVLDITPRQHHHVVAPRLNELDDLLMRLGIYEIPTELIKVLPGMEQPGFPPGTYIPVFPQEECGIDEFGMKKIYYNLHVLASIEPYLPDQRGSSR